MNVVFTSKIALELKQFIHTIFTSGKESKYIHKGEEYARIVVNRGIQLFKGNIQIAYKKYGEEICLTEEGAKLLLNYSKSLETMAIPTIEDVMHLYKITHKDGVLTIDLDQYVTNVHMANNLYLTMACNGDTIDVDNFICVITEGIEFNRFETYNQSILDIHNTKNIKIVLDRNIEDLRSTIESVYTNLKKYTA